MYCADESKKMRSITTKKANGVKKINVVNFDSK